MNGISACFLFIRNLTGLKREQKTSCFFQSPLVVFNLARGQQSAVKNYSRKLKVTHRSAVLETLYDFEQIDNVLVEIKDLRSKLEIRIAQEI